MKGLIRNTTILCLAAAVLACTQVARAADAKPPEKEVQGKITAVDAAAGTVAIKHKKDTMTFTAAPDIEFGGDGNKKLTLADLKVGDHITVHYTEESGKLMAHKIGHVDTKDKAN